MMIGDKYWSTFLTEGHTLEEKIAWIAAYTLYLSESPTRPGWCQKKADDDYGKFIGKNLLQVSEHFDSGPWGKQ